MIWPQVAAYGWSCLESFGNLGIEFAPSGRRVGRICASVSVLFTRLVKTERNCSGGEWNIPVVGHGCYTALGYAHYPDGGALTRVFLTLAIERRRVVTGSGGF